MVETINVGMTSKVTRGHQEWCQSVERIRLPISDL